MTEKKFDMKLEKNECRLLDDSLYCNLGDQEGSIERYGTERAEFLDAFNKIEKVGHTKCGDIFHLSEPKNPDIQSLDIIAVYEWDFVPHKLITMEKYGITELSRNGSREEYTMRLPHSFYYKECKRHGLFHHSMAYTDDISDQLLAQKYLKKLDVNI